MSLYRALSAFGIGCVVMLSMSGVSHADDDRPCLRNYTVKGSFFTGKTYTTWQDFPDVAPLTAFKRAYAYLVKDGWKINQTDKDIGAISASKEVGKSQSETFNVLIQELGKGNKTTITRLIPAGASALKGEIEGQVCGILAEVGKNEDPK